MHFGGFEKMDLVNYPGHVAATVFTNGCNFRCPYCHNGALVLGKADDFSEEEVFAYLKQRRRMLEGVVVSGGEPCLNAKELPSFLSKLKDMDFDVKLDTNGSFPALVKELVKEKLVDYVAMDIKSSPAGYAKACGHDAESCKESVEFLLGGAVEYEFRTTCVKGLIEPSDFLLIGDWIKGAKRYYLQAFNPAHTLDPAFESYSSFTREELSEIAERLRPLIPSVQVR